MSHTPPPPEPVDGEEIPNLMRQVGARLREARLSAGLSQAEAAAIADMTQNRLSRMERGLIDATLRSLIRAAIAVQMPPEDLLDHVDFSGVRLESRTYLRSPDPSEPDRTTEDPSTETLRELKRSRQGVR